MNSLDRIAIAPEKLARWLDVAHGFSLSGSLLVIELTEFANNPVRHRARRAADAARDQAAFLQGPSKGVAEALTAELENASKQAP